MKLRSFGGACIAALTLLIAELCWAVDSKNLPILRGIGGDFSAQSTLGREVQLSEFSGRPVLLVFGYTNCSDICPVTLGHLSVLTKDNPDLVHVLFVSIDSEYDTVDHLKAYLSHFDDQFIGITDRRESIDRIVQLYQARYSQVGDRPLSTGYKKFKVVKPDAGAEQAYLYTHSATIYLLDQQGRTRGTYFNGTPISQMLGDIESLHAEGRQL